MQIPDFDRLKSESKERDGVASYAEGMHPNPKFYKYYWWVFHKDSPCDGREFLSPEYRLACHKAWQKIEQLKAQGERCWIYNEKIPRKDAQNPWDPDSAHWQGQEWALPYDEDLDPVWDGHK